MRNQFRAWREFMTSSDERATDHRRARALRTHEARLIDEKRFDEWYELFTDDALLLGAGGARADRPAHHNSLAYEDKLLLKLRIERLKSPLAYSQQPASRCLHVLQEPDIEKARPRRRRVPDAHAVHLHRDAGRRVAALRRDRLAHARLVGRTAAHPAEARRHPELRRRPALDPALPVKSTTRRQFVHRYAAAPASAGRSPSGCSTRAMR